MINMHCQICGAPPQLTEYCKDCIEAGAPFESEDELEEYLRSRE